MKFIQSIVALLIIGLVAAFLCAFVVDEREQVFITQFGQPVGDPITEAGLHFKIPFVQKVRSYDRRILEWDGSPNQVPTKDKKYIEIDTFARWRVTDPLIFFQNVADESGAQGRLDDILDGATRSVIAQNNLVEIIRSKEREAVQSDASDLDGQESTLPAFQFGRDKIAAQILNDSKSQLMELGIELVDIRFKRINYSPGVQSEIFNRMMAERNRIADKFRSEGRGEAAKIDGQRERELKTIDSEAYRQSQEIIGQGDADAVAIYAAAFDQSDASREFYTFLKTMETYESSLTENDHLILSTDSEFYRYLKTATPTKP